MSKDTQFNYITYGAKTHADNIQGFLAHLLNQLKTSDDRHRVTPLCIWGMHGIGKTELVQEFAKENACQFTYIAPAQFEEMGDLLGLPAADASGTRTKFLPPAWVPRDPGPGILLIDDVNRADDRILRGIMQLLQNHELVSWRLPEKWMLVLTANPDGGDYSVTTMDDAMITRMLHVTMQYDVKAWARWAEKAGIDSRGISFVLTYPEVVNSRRTTPRSLVQFFNTIQSIGELKADLELVRMLAEGCLDRETAVAFTNFVNMDLSKLIPAKEILQAKDFDEIAKRINGLVNGTPKRLDVLSVIMTRLTNHLLYMAEKLDDKMFDNLRRFILMPVIPNDLRLGMAQDLVKSNRSDLKRLYAIPEVGKLILAKM